ncbi:hypothetical protein ITX31_02970 [Arthrobacter gandavensis]|uniref:hypothetical protein n=1 Tax=Arthrobacter gandavensis TaxID=169960 RepID=UPI00188F299B|nr:hypothetical protein [Arthrobacter gandavensis]MBF4993074.1 hypothetical protein [Arthrobacter gandavensis]
MNLLYSLTLTVTSPIEGDLKPGLEEGDITPGLLGFLATLFLALCVVFLIRDMVKRIRRVRYRSQVTGEGGEPAGGGSAEGGAETAVETAEAPADGADPRRSSSNPAG